MLLRAGAKFCGADCRAASNYAQKRAKSAVPGELRQQNRWVRWKPLKSRGRVAKMPITFSGRAASSTDPGTWGAYDEALESRAGVGIGFVLNGDGIACVDLDDVISDGEIDPRAKQFVEELAPFHLEISQSGKGVHAWVYGGAPDGRKVYSRDDGLRVEWYSDGRFIALGTPIGSLDQVSK